MLRYSNEARKASCAAEELSSAPNAGIKKRDNVMMDNGSHVQLRLFRGGLHKEPLQHKCLGSKSIAICFCGELRQVRTCSKDLAVFSLVPFDMAGLGIHTLPSIVFELATPLIVTEALQSVVQVFHICAEYIIRSTKKPSAYGIEHDTRCH